MALVAGLADALLAAVLSEQTVSVVGGTVVAFGRRSNHDSGSVRLCSGSSHTFSE